MNKKILSLFIIPLVITIIYFAVQAFILFNHFGVFSIVKEVSLSYKKTNQRDVHLLKNQKVSATFKASDDNLGILFVPLVKFGKASDQIVFRIKEEGDLPAGRQEKWYHESIFRGDQVQNNQYFPLGFPPITDSKNNKYVFEIESLTGSYQSGIGVIKDKPARLLYKYSIRDLTDFKTLWSFISKKFIYVGKNINYIQLAAVFVISYLFVFFIRKARLTTAKTVNFLLNYKMNSKRASRWIISKVNTNYRLQKKKILYFTKQVSKIFVSTKIHALLNTNWKKRLIISLLIFLLAFTFRFSASLVSYESLFYNTLGGGGDYDQFIRASTCALNLCSLIVHQNLLVESTILGTFYEMLGFIGGIKTYLYLMFITSSIVATLPYLLLSRRNWITLGGIIGSLFLATSDFLTQVALSFPPDNLSLFTFSIFFIVYFFTLQMGTIRWLLFFGLVGLVDGMTKALFLINDLAAFALFVPAFFYEKTRKTALPRAKQLRVILKRKNIKILLLALLPLLIFLILYSAWEYFVQIKFTAPYFLRLLVETGGSNFRFETLFYNRSSGEAEQDLILQLFYLLISGLVMIKRMTNISNLQVIFLAPIFFGLLFFSFIKSNSKFKLSLVKLGTMFFLSLVSIALLVSVKNNYLGIHEVFPGEYIYANWTLETYVSVFLFASIIFLFILKFRYQAFILALPIIPYVIMLIILTKNAPWERLLAHVIVWSIILFSFLIDWILSNAKENNALKRLWIGSIILVLFISFYTIPKTANMVGKLWEGINIARSEVKYLKWVNSELPENSIVLAGGKSDLIAVGENINRPMVYNSLWSTSLLIRSNRIPGISPQDFTLIGELGNKENFNNKRYLVLEDDIDLWKGRLQGVGDSVFTTDQKSNIALHAEDFSIKVYKTNQELNKNIYELRPKDESSL